MIRTAVIGCGAISQEHLGFLATCDLVDLVGVCDTSPVAADFARSRSGARAAFVDAAEMLTVTTPDVVHVLTPPASHETIIERCLEADAHVICEKPITLTAPAFDRLQLLAAGRGRWLLENHNLLFNDEVQAIDALMASGRLGEIRAVDIVLSTWLPSTDLRAPGGAIHDVITHAVYLALHFLGSGAIEDVDARWTLGNPSTPRRFDQLVATLHGHGRHATIRIGNEMRPLGFRVHVRGTEGSVETDLYQPYIRAEVERGDPLVSPLLNQAVNGTRLVTASVGNLRRKILQHTPYHGLQRFLAQCYRALDTGGPPPVSADDIRATLLTIDALVAKADR